MTRKAMLSVVPPVAETAPPRRTITTLTVVFGPSRSRLIPRAIEHARAGGASLTELSPGRYRASFTLRGDPAAFAHVAALSGLVRHWRGSEFLVDGEPILSTLVWEMGFCASEQLVANGRCRVPFEAGIVPDRCDACPLFDPERAREEAALSRSGDRRRARAAGLLRGEGSFTHRVRRLRVVGEGERGAGPTAFTLVFGPSRSWDVQRALERAEVAASELSRRPDGSYWVEFILAEDPEPYLALEGILRLLVNVRGTELISDGLPVPLSAVYRARQQLASTYVVPPPRDLVALIVDDLTGDVRASAPLPPEELSDPWPKGGPKT